MKTTFFKSVFAALLVLALSNGSHAAGTSTSLSMSSSTMSMYDNNQLSMEAYQGQSTGDNNNEGEIYVSASATDFGTSFDIYMDGNYMGSSTTGSGSFVISGLSAGTYSISVSTADGSDSQMVSVS